MISCRSSVEVISRDASAVKGAEPKAEADKLGSAGRKRSKELLMKVEAMRESIMDLNPGFTIRGGEKPLQ